MNSKADPIPECMEILGQETGIAFERPGEVERLLQTRVTVLNLPGAGAYLSGLLDPAFRAREVEALAPSLTVGETYFMRDQDQIRAAVRHRIDRTRTATSLRLWSVGCSTGEEAYSLAILFEEERARGARLDYTIVATDINPAAVACAQRGRYGGRSIRTLAPELRDRYFVKVGGEYTVGEALRQRLSFTAINLASPAHLPPGGLPFDVVLCRNVLIYFRPDAFKKAIEWLYTSLKPQGALFLGHAESLNFEHSGLYIEQVGGVFAYIKRPAERRVRQRLASSTWMPAIAPPPVTPSPDVASIRMALARGQRAEAAVLCRQRIDAHPLEPLAYRILYGVQMACGEIAQAREVLGKLLYLDPADMAARWALAQCLAKLGDKDGSRREYRALSGKLAGMDPDALVPDSDGLTCRTLAELVQVACGDRVVRDDMPVDTSGDRPHRRGSRV